MVVGAQRLDNLDAIRFEWWHVLDERRHSEVIALYNSVIEEETIIGYSQPLVGSKAAAVIASLVDALNRRAQTFFAILDRDELVGMALLTQNPLPNCSHIVEFSKGIIRPSHRGSGILESAMTALAEHCVEHGSELITLDVRENSRSHRLWSMMGFRQYGRLDDYARVNGLSYAGVYMCVNAAELLRNMRDRRKVGSSRTR